ncbi:MAG: cell division protein FtsA [Bacteroidetes bacterium]|nr:MAG: cell division protein FtsA [Bacteroidota bacterium]REK03493.1 MAG: cell division protein FtsA [Bacteroidota bacterium]REK34798.1 MAG: cell division protein FtsA [Bacteroidota bacterium]REK51322.1 MAG: cell division protein FtsA [Bacteroidota bacterium]
MENNDIVTGLDIGTTKICTIIGRKNEFGKIDILGYGKCESLGVTRGVVTNIVHTINSIKASVEEAELKAGVKVSDVYVGIAGQHIKSLQHRGMRTRTTLDDEISQMDIDAIVEDMYRLAMPPGEEIIHVIPQEYIVDNEQGIKNPIGMSGIRLEANCHIITGQVTAAKNIGKCVKRADLECNGLFLEPLASSEAVLTEEEKEAGVVLVDIGGGTTDIAIFQDGVIRHTAVIPFGGNVITDDIKEGCTIIRSHAELLKLKFGSALASENQENEIVAIPGLRGREPKEISVRNLASIIQARMEEIIEHVYYEIRNSGYEKKLIAGIVITGGGAQLRHIVQLVEFITGMDTRIGYPNEHLAKGMDELKSPMFATGVGLVIKGFQEMSKKKKDNKSAEALDEIVGSLGEKRGKEMRQPSFFDKIKAMLTEDDQDTKIE